MFLAFCVAPRLKLYYPPAFSWITIEVLLVLRLQRLLCPILAHPCLHLACFIRSAHQRLGRGRTA
jgi:hypothetical protein